MAKNRLETNVCVIGAGPAGITVARELSAAGVRVVILESGQLDEDPRAQELLEGRAVGPVIKDFPSYLTESRAARVHGSASRWGGWCTPFTPIDFEERAWVSESGWPLTAADLAPYWTRAARAMNIRPFADDPAPLPDGTELTSSRVQSHTYHFPPDAGILRTEFLRLRNEPGVRAELGTTAIDLITDGGRVQRVRALRPDGAELHVEADAFVLAAGGIENARMLLLNSEETAAGHQGLATNDAVLGRYFHEHFHVLAGRVHIPNAGKWEDYLEISPHAAFGHDALRALVPTDDVQRSEGLLNTSVQVSGDRVGPTQAIASDGPIEGELVARSEQVPNPNSRVVLDNERDRLGRRRAVLHWDTVDLDWHSIVTSVSIVAEELRDRWGVKTELLIEKNSPWPWTPSGPAPGVWPTWGNHHMGTTRMAADPTRGVVDSDCRVYGTANLYVAGSSVFPTGSFANPTFTIIAMGMRLADHLKA